MKTYNTMEIPLLVLKILGLYSETKTKKVSILTTMYCLIGLYVEIMALIQFPHIQDVSQFIDNTLLFNGFAQAMVKMLVFAQNQEKFHKILSDRKHFWKTSTCPDEFKLKLDALGFGTVRLQKLFLYSCTASEIVVLLGLLAGRPLPMGIWVISGHDTLYKTTVVLHLIGIPIMNAFLPTYDNLFLALAVETVIQFRILCFCLKELNVSEETETEYYAKLTLYVQHHSFLLRFLEALQDYFSGAMLIEYLTISSFICAEMYTLFESFNVEHIIKHSIVAASMLLQLAFYCFTAHMVSSEALSVSDAIYDSDWYSKYNPTLRHPMVLIIQRSQQKFAFTAGGLIEMNIRTLLVVLRLSYSACTIMIGLRNKH